VLAFEAARCDEGHVQHSTRTTSAAEGGAPGYLNVGSFRFWFAGERWEWSDEVARMHGYEPGSVAPTTKLLLSHKHPDDREHVLGLFNHGFTWEIRF
jgi:hypothetical protein